MSAKTNFDVIIIGGSYSGLSAAMALGRALRKALIIDAGKPCNRFTPYSHNLITHDGEKPHIISEKAKMQVLKYNTISFLNDQVTSGSKIQGSFSVGTLSGKKFTAKKLVIATGVKDIMPPIEGYPECWGVSILHCPYCHGYERKNEKTAIIANGDSAFQYAQLISNWTKDLAILTNGKSTLTKNQSDKIAKHEIPIIETEIDRLEHENGYVKQIHFQDHSVLNLKAIYSRPPFAQHCAVPVSIGCELDEQGLIKVDMFQKTSVEGIFACGDCASPFRAITSAIATGGIAGAMVNHRLREEEFD